MKIDHKLQWRGFFPLMLILLSPSAVYAHTGLGDTSGLWNGLTHPLTGLDHLCAMIGVGLWAAQRGGKAIWLVPLAFVGVMALGGLLGTMAIAIPFVEPGIVASVLILGILIAAAVRLPLLLSVFIVGTFALFHGHAHGAEMLHTYSAMAYGIGFLVTTALLHFCGIALGLVARQSGTVWLVRYAGALIMLCGVYLCFAA
jgi:urease accessory protein